MGYAYFDLEKAITEMRRLFQGQWSNGMLPHLIFPEGSDTSNLSGPAFWQSHLAAACPSDLATSAIIHPPYPAIALWRIYQAARNKSAAKGLLKELYPRLMAFHRYLYECRDPLEEGLIVIRHPWESGMAESPVWDEVLEAEVASLVEPAGPVKKRGGAVSAKVSLQRSMIERWRQRRYEEEGANEESAFLIQDPGFNAVLSYANECLIQIGDTIGENVQEVLQWHELTIYSMNHKLWDVESGLYYPWDLRHAEPIEVPTIASLLPLAGEVPTQEQAELMLFHLEGTLFGGKNDDYYCCPTYHLVDPDFDPAADWRGAVRPHTNWMLLQGLLRYDFQEMVLRLLRDTSKLISELGFYEYYDARHSTAGGTGYGTARSPVTAAIALDIGANF